VVVDKNRYSISYLFVIIAIVLIIAEHYNWRQNVQNFIGNKTCFIQNNHKINRYSDKIDFVQKLHGKN